MKRSKSHSELFALRDAALDDLAATTDEELLRESAEGEQDLHAVTEAIRSSMRDAAAAAARSRMELARVAMRRNRAARPESKRERPALETMKDLVMNTFRAKPELRLAFRDGAKQEDQDWASLYDDLLQLGEIGPEDGDKP